MRWLTFITLVVLVVSLQSTVAGRLTCLGAAPDWVLVLVVFYALHARAAQAMAAGWLAGAAIMVLLSAAGVRSGQYFLQG